MNFTRLIKVIVLGQMLWGVNTFPTRNGLPSLKPVFVDQSYPIPGFLAFSLKGVGGDSQLRILFPKRNSNTKLFTDIVMATVVTDDNSTRKYLFLEKHSLGKDTLQTLDQSDWNGVFKTHRTLRRTLIPESVMAPKAYLCFFLVGYDAESPPRMEYNDKTPKKGMIIKPKEGKQASLAIKVRMPELNSLKCFSNFQLAPTLEEYERLLGLSLIGRQPYLYQGNYPSWAKVMKMLKVLESELAKKRLRRNDVESIPRAYLEKRMEYLSEVKEVKSKGSNSSIDGNVYITQKLKIFIIRGLQGRREPIIKMICLQFLPHVKITFGRHQDIEASSNRTTSKLRFIVVGMSNNKARNITIKHYPWDELDLEVVILTSGNFYLIHNSSLPGKMMWHFEQSGLTVKEMKMKTKRIRASNLGSSVFAVVSATSLRLEIQTLLFKEPPKLFLLADFSDLESESDSNFLLGLTSLSIFLAMSSRSKISSIFQIVGVTPRRTWRDVPDAMLQCFPHLLPLEPLVFLVAQTFQLLVGLRMGALPIAIVAVQICTIMTSFPSTFIPMKTFLSLTLIGGDFFSTNIYFDEDSFLTHKV
ncbi:hypothetical protein CR513_46416, partial [Mucuna pruriens]